MLVEGDDLSEPISDAIRGILDGHLWLSRDLANRGHYPAIDILESISRVMPDIVDQQHSQAAQLIVQLTAVYRDIEDLVNIGAYAAGTNPEYDLALRARPEINEFLQQKIAEGVGLDQAISNLKKLAAQIANASNVSNVSNASNAEKTNAQTTHFPNNTNHSPNQQISAGLKKTMAGT